MHPLYIIICTYTPRTRLRFCTKSGRHFLLAFLPRCLEWRTTCYLAHGAPAHFSAPRFSSSSSSSSLSLFTETKGRKGLSPDERESEAEKKRRQKGDAGVWASGARMCIFRSYDFLSISYILFLQLYLHICDELLCKWKCYANHDYLIFQAFVLLTCFDIGAFKLFSIDSDEFFRFRFDFLGFSGLGW